MTSFTVDKFKICTTTKPSYKCRRLLVAAPSIERQHTGSPQSALDPGVVEEIQMDVR